jgi:hypothetical protein
MGTLEGRGAYPALLTLDDIIYVDKFGGAVTEDGYITLTQLQALLDATLKSDTSLTGNGYFKNDSSFATPDASKVPSELAVKVYVDANIAGVPAKENAHVATDTYLDNVGVGTWTKAGTKATKTLTAGSVGILTIDGIATVLGDRIYIKNEDGSSTNLTDVDQGMYDVTTEGTAGVAAILTRSEDFNGDPASEVKNGVYAYVTLGTLNSNSGWRVLAVGTVDVDVDPMVITQFQGLPGNHAASHTNGTDDIQDATLAQKGLMTIAQATKLDTVEQRANHTGTQLMSTVSDAGALATLDQVDTPEIVDLAVTTAKLADLSVTTPKIVDDAVTPEKNSQFSANGEEGSTQAMVPFTAAPIVPVEGTFWFSVIGGLTYINYHISGVTKSVELS